MVRSSKMASRTQSHSLIFCRSSSKLPVALIVPDFDHLKSWCKINGISEDGNENLIKNKQVVDRIQNEVNHYNTDFSQHEKVKNTVLIPHVWSINNDELTHTQKLKRRVILDKYRKFWEPLYEN